MQNQIFNGISSSAVSPQMNYLNAIAQLEQTLKSNAQQLMRMYQQGLVTDNQAQYFTNKLLDTQNQINLLKQSLTNEAPAPASSEKISPMEIFNQENPGFFDRVGRKDVLNYINNFDMDKDEINKIAAIVEALEQSAIDGYLKQSAHEKTLNDENYAAKSKLTSYAQRAPYDSNYNKVFTREDIGNMSGEEFAKNEKLIMEQVKQGLIK